MAHLKPTASSMAHQRQKRGTLNGVNLDSGTIQAVSGGSHVNLDFMLSVGGGRHEIGNWKATSPRHRDAKIGGC
jgi:hypothetical protein